MPKGVYSFLMPVIGLLALLWIIFRVAPKPDRAQYPCVKAATPIAFGFLAYLGALILSSFAFFKTRKIRFLSPLFAGLVVLLFGFTGLYVADRIKDNQEVVLESSVHIANQPIGTAKGMFPGRVVWVYDANATNESCIPSAVGHAWWLSENNNQSVIDGMVGKAIQSLTGETTNEDSWDEIFKYHNNTRGKGSVPYAAGEKIFIKVNNVSGWSGNYSTSNLSVTNNSYYGISETSPQIVLSVLRQLVQVVGVAQQDIYVGDPLRNLYKHSYDTWHSEFPNVHYMSHDNYTSLGREQLVASTTARITYSDNGTILRENVWDASRPGGAPVSSDFFYQIYEDAEYMLNIPMLKGHKRAGVTMFAKNHFGSHTRADASHLHNGLVDPQETPNLEGVSRTEYGMYRVQVDLMGHHILGGKSLFYLMDALWAADQEIGTPKKFSMQPFNNDWMSSVFASFDPVAIESVGYDFLRSEFTSNRNIGDGAGTYPQKPAADDYLHQAADTTLWPIGIKYQPDGNGVHLKSLGTHEHWDNSTDKNYSRNLESGTGTGIELVKVLNPANGIPEPELPEGYSLDQNFPNPFYGSTQISYSIPVYAKVVIKVYDIAGREVKTLENGNREPGTHTLSFDGTPYPAGEYHYKMMVNGHSKTITCVLVK